MIKDFFWWYCAIYNDNTIDWHIQLFVMQNMFIILNFYHFGMNIIEKNSNSIWWTNDLWSLYNNSQRYNERLCWKMSLMILFTLNYLYRKICLSFRIFIILKYALFKSLNFIWWTNSTSKILITSINSTFCYQFLTLHFQWISHHMNKCMKHFTSTSLQAIS